jgi:hypothetical protein
VFVDVTGPLILEDKERSEDESRDEEGEEDDTNESPEIEQTLMKQGAEAGWGVGLVAEEGSWDEEEVEKQVERD